MFRDLESCNVGFKKWHPTPVTPYGDKLAGQSELGGVWEWTSTILAPHEGFHPMEAYPGYTSTQRLCVPHGRMLLTWECHYSGLLRWKAQHCLGWFMGDASADRRTNNIVSARTLYAMCFHTHVFPSINFYQHNYPYAWVGARLVRDI